MKLIDLLEVIEDSQTVIIADAENNQIAIYDGRDSIPAELSVNGVIEVLATEYDHLPALRVLVYE